MSHSTNSTATNIDIIFDEEDFQEEKPLEEDDIIFEEYRKLNEKCDQRLKL